MILGTIIGAAAGFIGGAAAGAGLVGSSTINAAAYTAVNLPRQIAEVALSGIIGTYGYIRAHELQRDYYRLAEEQIAQAERYLTLSERNYNEIAVVSFNCQKELFTRYRNEFSGRETEFLMEAFKFDEYTPDFGVQRGRAIGDVSRAFSRARQQRRRNTGKYNTGRSCHDNTQLAIAQARAEAAAMNNAYRFEEGRKFRFDQWFFQRMTAGVATVSDMAGRVVSGVNGGTAGANSALAGIGGALQVRGAGVAQAGQSLANSTGLFNDLATLGFGNAQQLRGEQRAESFLQRSGILPSAIQNSGQAPINPALGTDISAGNRQAGGLAGGIHSILTDVGRGISSAVNSTDVVGMFDAAAAVSGE